MGFFQDLGKGISRALTPPKNSFLRPLIDVLAPMIPGYGQIYSLLRYGGGLMSGEDTMANIMGLTGALGAGGLKNMGSNLGSLNFQEALGKLGGPGFFEKMAPLLAGGVAQQMSAKKTDYLQQVVKQQLGLQKLQIDQARNAAANIDKNDASAVTNYSKALNNAVAPALQNVENRIMRTTNGRRGTDTEAGVQKGAIASEAGKELGKFEASLDSTREQRKGAALAQAQAGVAGSWSGAQQADLNSKANSDSDQQTWLKFLGELFDKTPGTTLPAGKTNYGEDFRKLMDNMTMDYKDMTPGIQLPSFDYKKYYSEGGGTRVPVKLTP